MFNADVRDLLLQVFTSWQVLVVTLVIVLYFFLINYVANVYYHRARKAPMPKKKKAQKEEGPVVDAKDDLGLEEHTPSESDKD